MKVRGRGSLDLPAPRYSGRGRHRSPRLTGALGQQKLRLLKLTRRVKEYLRHIPADGFSTMLYSQGNLWTSIHSATSQLGQRAGRRLSLLCNLHRENLPHVLLLGCASSASSSRNRPAAYGRTLGQRGYINAGTALQPALRLHQRRDSSPGPDRTAQTGTLSLIRWRWMCCSGLPGTLSSRCTRPIPRPPGKSLPSGLGRTSNASQCSSRITRRMIFEHR